MTKSEETNRDVTALLKARVSLLWIVTREELRVESAIVEAAAAAKYPVVFWDCFRGLVAAEGDVLNADTDPQAVLQTIGEEATRRLYVLRDLNRWQDPVTIRALRSLARELQGKPANEARSIVILTPSSEIPEDLQASATVIDYPLPERAEIEAILDETVESLPDDLREGAVNGNREEIVDAAVGLTADEAANCYARSLVTTRAIDPAIVSSEKKRVIAREQVLEWHDPDPRGLDAIGGLDVLKGWLAKRRVAFSQEARDYGLPAPKGAMLVGVPGCGKSLTAKAVASAWGMPLLRLDLGALKSKWIGESEANIRRALSVAETVAPCVLWLDEIEKALAGATSGAADGGVSSDALGAVLSWMQERQGSVFVVATANDVSALPPELLRKGRFDELFFVGVPTREERKAIVGAALAQHGREVDGIDVAQVADATDQFTGAEIAAIVPDALFEAYADGARELTTDDLVTAASGVTPLTKTADEKIRGLREWAKGRCRNASLEESVTTKGGRQIEV